jgi:hypothetical protein
MAIGPLTDCSITYAGQDLSDHADKVMIDMSSDEVEVTAFGGTAHAFVPGLRADSIQITFLQDWASNKVDQTLNTYQGSTTGATMVIKPTSATVSSTNPTYTAVVTPFSYHPIDGSVGDANKTDVTFRCVQGGKITRATA